MIPLRVSLKNFLCHDDQEFRFESHPVWLLHGPNGVGKSAVFDAMLYALYAESRRGDTRKNAVVEIIRHGQGSMRVEFDFELADQRYRVWRTRARSGQPKQGVNQWTNGAWPPVRDVNSARELEDWVAKTLGLNYKTFVSAVLLRQGAAENLIDADKDDRREVFRSFVELDPYIRLHERVTEARRDAGADAKHHRASLEGMPVVGDDQVNAATIAASAADTAWENARAVERAVREWLAQSCTWETYEQARQRIQGSLAAAADRSRRAARLERDVARLRELRLLTPALTKVGMLQGQMTIAEQEAKTRADEVTAANDQNRKLKDDVIKLRESVSDRREEVANLERQVGTQEAERKRLSDEVERFARASSLHETLGRLKTKSFDRDLDSRVAEAEQTVAMAQAVKDAMPFMEPLVALRADFRKAIADGTAAATIASAAGDDVARLRQAKQLAEQDLNKATARKNEAEQAAAVAKDQFENATTRRERFAAMATKPACSECGQPIDAKHAAKERTKLKQAFDDAKSNSKRCGKEVEAASRETIAAQERHRQLDADCRDAEQRHGDALRARKDASSRSATARTTFMNCLSSLDEPFAKQVTPIADEGFPAAADVAALRNIAKDLPPRIRGRDALRQSQIERDRINREIIVLEQSVAAVGAPADVTAARSHLANFETALKILKRRHAQAAETLASEEKTEIQLYTRQQELGGQIARLSADAAAAQTLAASWKTQLEAAIDLVPESHRASATTTTPNQLQTLVNELDELHESKAEEDFAAFIDDRALESERNQQMSEFERRIAELPPESRRNSAEIEREVADAEAATKLAEQSRDAARSSLQTLTNDRDRRTQIERQLAAADRNHALHDRLFDLLGAEGIQLDLVRNAESRIIARADEILGRLSTGELRFEPPDPASTRAFDLSVRRRDCPDPIAAANLSGGQRFRVAISLALAVCQGAATGAKPLDSIIIDEGFGALDRDGRMAMIAELRDSQTLNRMFKRVLVVSHQEDFAAAFPVGYRLRSEGGTTVVEEFGISDATSANS